MARETPEAARRWGAPSGRTTRVVGRRVLQGVIDVVVSWAAPLLSLALFLLVPVSADGTTVSIAGLIAVSVIVTSVTVALHGWYWVIHPARQRGQTWGMRLVGIRVVRDNGLPAGARALLVRCVMLIVDGLGLGLVGLVAMVASRRGQRLGDRVAGTLVVRDDG